MSLQESILGAAVGSVAVGTAVEMNVSPFFPGTKVRVEIRPNALTGTFAVQGSDDNSTWANVLAPGALTAEDRPFVDEIVLQRYMRTNMTAWTSGTADALILNS